MTPEQEQRSQAARHAAIQRWGKPDQDPYEGTKAARKGFLAKFEHQVDPDGVLDPAERHRRAHAAMRRYMRALRAKRTMSDAKKAAQDAA